MKRSKFRFIYMVVVGIIISYILEFVVAKEGGNRFFGMLTSVLITILVWEGNLWIDHWLDRKLPWMKMPKQRVLAQLLSSMVYSSVTMYFSMYLFNEFVCKLPTSNKQAFMSSSIVIGILISLIILTVEISTQFFGNWKKSLIEVEKYKAESLQAQLQNLKDQVNPHFLFNNLSVLSSLVYINQDKAVDFINQLSKVYRYVLDNKDNELVSLEAEMVFIKSYTYLFKIRFDESIEFYFDISEGTKQLLIPPMALQILIENAIKHNEISSEHPLKVWVTSFEEELIVKNNFQLRANPEPSSHTGLKNICDRYKHFTDKEMEVRQENGMFEVKIPLLKS